MIRPTYLVVMRARVGLSVVGALQVNSGGNRLELENYIEREAACPRARLMREFLNHVYPDAIVTLEMVHGVA